MEPDVTLWNGHQATCSIPTSSGGGVRSDPRLTLVLAGQIWGVAPAPDSVQLTLFPLKSSLSSSVTVLLFECRHSEVLLLTCFFTKNCTTDEI